MSEHVTLSAEKYEELLEQREALRQHVRRLDRRLRDAQNRVEELEHQLANTRLRHILGR